MKQLSSGTFSSQSSSGELSPGLAAVVIRWLCRRGHSALRLIQNWRVLSAAGPPGATPGSYGRGRSRPTGAAVWANFGKFTCCQFKVNYFPNNQRCSTHPFTRRFRESSRSTADLHKRAGWSRRFYLDVWLRGVTVCLKRNWQQWLETKLDLCPINGTSYVFQAKDHTNNGNIIKTFGFANTLTQRLQRLRYRF